MATRPATDHATAGRSPRPLAALLLGLAATLLLLGPIAGRAEAAPTPITDGSVTWGVKESWRNYIGASGTSVGEGATVNADGTYTFPVLSGSYYDEETETTLLKLGGWVHWQAYPDYPVEGRWGLYSTFKEMEVEIGPTAQVVRGTNIGYRRDDPGGTLHEDHGAILAKLDVSGATTDFGGGTSTWSGIPAVVGPGMNLTYAEGTQVDPVSIGYVGPGGVPDLGEHFAVPGGATLGPAARWVSGEALGSTADSGHHIYVSPGGRVVHVVELTGGNTSAAKMTITALDAQSMTPIGTPAQISFPLEAAGQYMKTAYDPRTESIFYAVGGEGSAQKELVVHVARLDAGAASYTEQVVGTVREVAAGLESLAWNPVTNEIAAITQLRASEGSSTFVKNRLTTFKEEAGAWVRKAQTPLPMPREGAYAGATATTTPFRCLGAFQGRPCLAVLPDGSYVQAPEESTVTVGGAELSWPAVRIVVNAAGEAQTSLIEGTELPSRGTLHPGYSAVVEGMNGQVLLHASQLSASSFARVKAEGAAAVLAEAPWAVGAHQGGSTTSGFAQSMAADAAHGWEWATDYSDPEGHVLDQVEGDRLLSRFKYAEFLSQGYPQIAVGADGSVYLPVKDKATGHFGYQRLEYVGELARFGRQPADAAVSLASGEEAKPVSFTSTVTGGDPADPARQWQVKPPGASTFADLEGQTGETLTVAATPADNGAEYRAVYTGAAGRIASEAARLTVEYAPRILADVANRTVTEGRPATFLVSAEGNPEPTVTWERRVGGYWQPISASDSNFRIEGSSLTIKRTNAEQTGSWFQATLTNAAGSVTSREAKLTVAPRTTVPAGGIEVTHASLDWLGNGQMQGIPHAGGSNYFSAGASDGKEDGYRSALGNAAVWQVSASGAETPATYATRAAHTTDGGEQLVRLYGGTGRIEPDGSARIAWDAEFSVNFYGGLVPFTIEDPKLTVEADGSGTLTATLLGCSSSMAEINRCTPLAPATDVVVANFTGVAVEPGKPIAVEPQYRGVAVDVPSGAGSPQTRSGPDWGAWPQSFVSFQLQTGLASYWYSSGEEDDKKVPLPFTVDLEGPEPPAASAPGGPGSAETGGGAGAGHSAGGPAGTGTTTVPGGTKKKAGRPARVTPARTVRLDATGAATVARLACPKGGPACETIVPARIAARIDGRRYLLSVAVPKRVKAGRTATVTVRVPKAARSALGRGKVAVRLRIAVRSGKKMASKVATVTIVGRG